MAFYQRYSRGVVMLASIFGSNNKEKLKEYEHNKLIKLIENNDPQTLKREVPELKAGFEKPEDDDSFWLLRDVDFELDHYKTLIELANTIYNDHSCIRALYTAAYEQRNADLLMLIAKQTSFYPGDINDVKEQYLQWFKKAVKQNDNKAAAQISRFLEIETETIWPIVKTLTATYPPGLVFDRIDDIYDGKKAYLHKKGAAIGCIRLYRDNEDEVDWTPSDLYDNYNVTGGHDVKVTPLPYKALITKGDRHLIKYPIQLIEVLIQAQTNNQNYQFLQTAARKASIQTVEVILNNLSITIDDDSAYHILHETVTHKRVAVLEKIANHKAISFDQVYIDEPPRSYDKTPDTDCLTCNAKFLSILLKNDLIKDQDCIIQDLVNNRTPYYMKRFVNYDGLEHLDASINGKQSKKMRRQLQHAGIDPENALTTTTLHRL